MTCSRVLPAVFLALAACAGARPSERAAAQDGNAPAAASAAAPAHPGGDMAGMQGREMPCPMAVPGTRVRAAEVEGGMALLFTNPEDPAAVQERARRAETMHARMAQHHAAQAGGMHGGTSGGMHGTPGEGQAGCCAGMSEQMAVMHAAGVRAENLPDGARLVFTPSDPATLPQLRDAVVQHAEQLREHGCPMMRSMDGMQGGSGTGEGGAGHGGHHPR